MVVLEVEIEHVAIAERKREPSKPSKFGQPQGAGGIQIIMNELCSASVAEQKSLSDLIKLADLYLASKWIIALPILGLADRRCHLNCKLK